MTNTLKKIEDAGKGLELICANKRLMCCLNTSKLCMQLEFEYYNFS